MKRQAAELASKGRFGDTQLVHMNPIEVEALARLSPTGELTTNPDTGQPEAFLPLLGALAGGWLAPSMGLGLTAAMGAGLGSAAGSLMQGDDFGTAVAGGLMSYGLGSMLNAAGGVSPGVDAAATEASLAPTMANADPTKLMGGSGVIGPEMIGQNAVGGLNLAPSGGIHPSMLDVGVDASMYPGLGSASAAPTAATAAPSVGPLNEGMTTMDGMPLDQYRAIPVGPAPFPEPVAQPNLTDKIMAAQPNPNSGITMARQPGMFDRASTALSDAGSGIADKWNALPPAVGPDTITNPAYAEMGIGDKMSYLSDQGWGKSLSNAVTGNPIGTTAFGVGAMSGGLGALTGVGQQAQIPTSFGKTYAKRPYQKSGNKRSFVAQPAGYRPGIDPEHAYLDPIGTYDQSFAAGGIVQPGAGYRPGIDAQHDYGFGLTQPRAKSITASLAPSVPSLTPTLPPSLGGGGDRDVGEEQDNPDVSNSAPMDNSTKGSALGTIASLATGVPGLGLVAGAIGHGMDVSKMNDTLSSMREKNIGYFGSMFGNHGVYGDAIDSIESNPGTVDQAANEAAMGLGPFGGPGGATSSGGAAAEAAGANDGPGSAGPFADGGEIEAQEQDPITSNAKAAILGNHPEPAKAIQVFVGTYGEKAFVQLRQQVIAEATQDQRAREGIGGMIQGPGTGTSDSIPGQIMQDGVPVEDIKVADGEYIVPKAQVDEYKDNGMMAKLEGDRKAIVGKNNEPRMA